MATNSFQPKDASQSLLCHKIKEDIHTNQCFITPQLSQEAMKHINHINQFDPISSKSSTINNLEVQQFLSTLSLREKYEDLLTRKELILPPKYQMLLKKQSSLDIILSSEPKNNRVEHIRNKMQNYYNLNFTNEDFEKMLFVAPFYYIYQSKKRLNGMMDLLYIDFPDDYDKRMKMKFTENTNFNLLQTQFRPYQGKISPNTLNQRKGLFKKVLMHMTKVEHEQFIKTHQLGEFDPTKNRTWHHLFDVNNVKDIGNMKIIESNIKDKKKIVLR